MAAAVATDATYEPISESTTAEDILAVAQDAKQIDEGQGLIVENRAEFTLIAPLLPGGADVFRSRVAKLQKEAAYWEGRIATVHDLRVVLLNNDTQILFCATYSQEFKPYVQDVIKFATPWIDHMFVDVAEGFEGLTAPNAVEYILGHQVEASVWFASNAQASPRDIRKSLQLTSAVDGLLDTLQA